MKSDFAQSTYKALALAGVMLISIVSFSVSAQDEFNAATPLSAKKQATKSRPAASHCRSSPLT